MAVPKLKKAPGRAVSAPGVVQRVRAGFHFLILLLSGKSSPLRKDGARIDTDHAFFKPPETARKYKEK
ncbi:MAG: hypothetical protein AB1468_04910 [Candidatus Micrarchaeota archaeon]